MNLTELSNLVNYRRRDTTEGFISSDEIKAYLNEALRKICSRGNYEWTKTSTSFSYVDGVSRYKLSAVASDFHDPINIFYNDDYSFEIVTPEQLLALSSGSYNLFAVDNDDLLVATSFGSGTLRLDYYSNYAAKTSGGSWIASLSATTDEPLMPALYQDCLVDFGAARCYQKEGMREDYQIAFNDFISGMNNLKTVTPSRKVNASKRIINGQDTTSGRFYDGKSDPLRTA